MRERLAISSNNIELLRQLDEAGWPADGLATMQRVCKTTALLSFGTFQPNRKPFSAHLVGVASIVAWDSRDPIRVGAAMAHSALEFGRFPSSPVGLSTVGLRFCATASAMKSSALCEPTPKPAGRG